MPAMRHQVRPSKGDVTGDAADGLMLCSGSVTASMRPILCASKALGMLPAQNVFWGRNWAVRSTRFSLEMLWSLGLLSLLTFLVMRYMWNSALSTITNTGSDQTDLLVVHIFCRVSGLEGLLAMAVMIAKSPSMCELLRRLDTLEENLRMSLVEEDRRFIKKNSKGTILAMAVTFSISQLAGPLLYTSIEYPTMDDKIFVTMLTTITLMESIPCVQMSFFTQVLCNRFKAVNSSIISMFPRPLKSGQLDPCAHYCRVFDSQNKHRLEAMRLLHHRVSRLVEVMGDTYGPSLLIHYTFALILTITATYATLFASTFEGYPNAVYACAAFDLIMIMRLVSSTILLSRIPSQATACHEDIGEVRLIDLDSDSRHQVEQLLLSLKGQPPQITASNFFSISRSLLTSMVASATTYLVVLIQFRMGSDTSSKPNSTEANNTA